MEKLASKVTFTLVTPYTVEEIHERLMGITTTPGPMPGNKVYGGHLTSSGFSLYRIISNNGRGRMTLIGMVGKYVAGESGTEIIIRSNAGDMVASTAALAIGLGVPVGAMFLPFIVIGFQTGKILTAIFLMIGEVAAAACVHFYIWSTRNTMFAELAKDRKILTKLLMDSEHDLKPAPRVRWQGGPQD